MRKIFLDCGTHFGQGLESIASLKNITNSWEIYSWEANPFTFNNFEKENFRPDLNIKFYNQAISSADGHLTLNVETMKGDNHTGQGSSIIDLEKWNNPMHKGQFLQQVSVPAIDFSSYIKNNFSIDDYIIIKMDIEGAEYNVLDKMITDSSVDFIKELYIEWHSRFFPNKDELKEKEKLILDILTGKGILVNNWI